MKRQIGREKLMLIVCGAMIVCVAILSFLAVGLKERGVKPEETAVSASVEIKGYMLPNGRIKQSIVIDTSDKGIEIEKFRELEEQVKNETLKTHTDLIVWDATFTYQQKDGTEETYTYTKTDDNEAVDEFLEKYYEDFNKDQKD